MVLSLIVYNNHIILLLYSEILYVYLVNEFDFFSWCGAAEIVFLVEVKSACGDVSSFPSFLGSWYWNNGGFGSVPASCRVAIVRAVMRAPLSADDELIFLAAGMRSPSR